MIGKPTNCNQQSLNHKSLNHQFVPIFLPRDRPRRHRPAPFGVDEFGGLASRLLRLEHSVQRRTGARQRRILRPLAFQLSLQLSQFRILGKDDSCKVVFNPGSDEVEKRCRCDFLGPVPARGAAPGSYRRAAPVPPRPAPVPIGFTATVIALEDEEGPALVIRQRPLPNQDPFTEARVVLRDPSVYGLDIRYLDEDGAWQERWNAEEEQALPRAVRPAGTSGRG